MSERKLSEGVGRGFQVPSGLYAIHNPEASLGHLAAIAAKRTGPSAPPAPKVEDNLGVAVLPISGVMFKSGGFEPGTDELKAVFHRLATSDQVSGILLDIYSPGGEAAGVYDFARTVFEARSRKKIVAFCNDLACSAAYWIASQAHTVVANETAVVGSVGVFKVVVDSSMSFDAMGVKVHCISTGHYKGMGLAGTPVKDEHLKHDQGMVNAVFETMLRCIAQGRGMGVDVVRKNMGDGRAHVVSAGSEAVKLGFIDKIGFFEDALAEAGYSKGGSRSGAVGGAERNSKMTEVRTVEEVREARFNAFMAMVKLTMDRNPGMMRSTASARVASQHPELHKAFLETMNPGRAVG